MTLLYAADEDAQQTAAAVAAAVAAAAPVEAQSGNALANNMRLERVDADRRQIIMTPPP